MSSIFDILLYLAVNELNKDYWVKYGTDIHSLSFHDIPETLINFNLGRYILIYHEVGFLFTLFTLGWFPSLIIQDLNQRKIFSLLQIFIFMGNGS